MGNYIFLDNWTLFSNEVISIYLILVDREGTVAAEQLVNLKGLVPINKLSL